MRYHTSCGSLFLLTAFAMTACSSGSESADTSQVSADEVSESAAPAADVAPPPASGAPLVGVDQMPATARFTVNGPKGYDQWNGSWTISSNRLGCGINTYPKMINFDIADEDKTRGDFEDLRIGSNDGPEVGGTTPSFSITLSLERPGPNLSIQPGQSGGSDTGTLTVLENASGNSRFKVTARSSNGVQFDGEFTCVPRTNP